MRLGILAQLIDAYHDFVKRQDELAAYMEDFDTSASAVPDPLGGDEGVTDWDKHDIDPDENEL